MCNYFSKSLSLPSSHLLERGNSAPKIPPSCPQQPPNFPLFLLPLFDTTYSSSPQLPYLEGVRFPIFSFPKFPGVAQTMGSTSASAFSDNLCRVTIVPDLLYLLVILICIPNLVSKSSPNKLQSQFGTYQNLCILNLSPTSISSG